MPSEWSAEIVAQMHLKSITGRKLAELTGYTEQYISQILRGHKDTEAAREKIKEALSTFPTTTS